MIDTHTIQQDTAPGPQMQVAGFRISDRISRHAHSLTCGQKFGLGIIGPDLIEIGSLGCVYQISFAFIPEPPAVQDKQQNRRPDGLWNRSLH